MRLDPDPHPESHNVNLACGDRLYIYLLKALESLWLLPWLQTVTAVREDEGNNTVIKKVTTVIRRNRETCFSEFLN